MINEGQRLGEFEILECLGQGGMGAVYKARQITLDRFVALKTLQAAIAADPEYITRFHREAKAAAALNHPNLVQVYSAGETDGLHWFAMEFVEGESAQARLRRKGQIEPIESIAIATHIATALDYAWRKAQLIHRDVKPDNIFLSNDGEVKLGDLGLAKSAGETQSLTTTGSSMGTPHYVSPEQVEGKKDVDLRADIYSLGCTLFHLLSGQPPYSAETAVAVMLRQVSAPVPNLRQVWPGCPAELARVVMKMMLKPPDARQQTYDEVIADLRGAYDALTGASMPNLVAVTQQPAKPKAAAQRAGAARPAYSPVGQKKSGALWSLIVVMLLAVGGYFAWQQFGQPKLGSEQHVESPSGDAFIREVAALPPDEQVKRVLVELKKLNPQFDPVTAQEKHTNADGKVTALDFRTLNVTDISPLRALTALEELNIGGTFAPIGVQSPLSDLSPLRGLPLTKLDVSRTTVVDLTPLKGMKLVEFHCNASPLEDLSPLSGMPLKDLTCWSTQVKSLAPVHGMPLRFLVVDGCPVSDLSPLSGMTTLWQFHSLDTPVENLSPLTGLKVNDISLGAKVRDLSVLGGLPLKVIKGSLDAARDGELLHSIKTLETINDKPAAEFFQTAPAATATKDAAFPILSFAGHRYQLVAMNCTWLVAKAGAEAMGGHLATFATEDEELWARDHLLTLPGSAEGRFYIGAHADAQSRDFRWTTGDPVGHLHWWDGHPDWRTYESKATKEPGVLFAAGVYAVKANPGGKWLVVSPESLKQTGFIVQWDDDGKSALAVSSAGYPLPAQWIDATTEFRKTYGDTLVADGQWVSSTLPAAFCGVGSPKTFRNCILRVVFSDSVVLALRRHQTDGDTRYAAVVEKSDVGINLDAAPGRKIVPVFRLPAPLGKDEPHEAVFAAHGETLTLWLDGKQIATGHDASFDSGTLAVLLMNDATRHSRIRKIEYGELPDGASTPDKPAVPVAINTPPQAPIDKSPKDVLAAVQVLRDFSQKPGDGEQTDSGTDWKLENGVLSATKSGLGGVIAPDLVLPPSYDLSLRVKASLGKDKAVGVLLPVGSHQMTVHLALQTELTGFEMIDKKHVGDSMFSVRPPMLHSDVEQLVEISVRSHNGDASVALKVDGKPALDWSGREDSLSTFWRWDYRTKRRGLGLFASHASVMFRDVRVRGTEDIVAPPPASAPAAAERWTDWLAERWRDHKLPDGVAWKFNSLEVTDPKVFFILGPMMKDGAVRVTETRGPAAEIQIFLRCENAAPEISKKVEFPYSRTYRFDDGTKGAGILFRSVKGNIYDHVGDWLMDAKDANGPSKPHIIEFRAVGTALTGWLDHTLVAKGFRSDLVQGVPAFFAFKGALIHKIEVLDLDAPSNVAATGSASATPATAPKVAPFMNSLGMKFVPVPGTKVLFSIWDTRVRDYAVYAAANKVDDQWTKQQKDGVPVSREPEYPVVGVSWDDAQAFCKWLTEKESAAGKLPKGARYRLPTDEEWSIAAGMPPEQGATPAEKNGKNTVDYPWGVGFPPKGKVGNYRDAAFYAKFPNEKLTGNDTYTDGFATSSPVGSFPSNAFGLYDMGGNVWQWCEDWYDATQKDRVLRGASWDNMDSSTLRSSNRKRSAPTTRLNYDYGFRCVLKPAPEKAN